MPGRPHAARAAADRAAAPAAGDIYLEYIPIDSLTRVVAVDAATGVEVTVFGPSSVSRDDLGRIAVRKLARRLASRG